MGAVVRTCLLLFSCWLFALFDSCSGSMEADHLLRFVQSKWPLIARDDESVDFLNKSESLSRAYVAPQVGLKDADRITALPGQPNGVDFAQYAGYVTVEPKNGTALFYYFVESPIDPINKPLLLWLNGGPGCSSLGFGAMQELGPFRVNHNGDLYLNKYSWNNVANIIFLDAPAGVGFSYSNTSSDNHIYGDKMTAMDSFTFLVNWLERFPEYKNRDFYITGESYAGHFGPQLAKLILLNNKNTDKPINLKGIAIGNAYVDANINSIERYEFLWSHAMYSDETHTLILKNCNMSNINSSDCLRAQFQADSEVGKIYLYNIYSSFCRITSDADNSSSSNLEYDPCASGYVFSYLNNASVQNALHAVRTSWTFCSMLDWSESEDSMLYTIKQLISSGIRVWLYSGDVDAVVPVTSTKSFIRLLKLPIESSWNPWYNAGDSEVAGYAVAYKGLTFVTVRGAGHEVPSYQPERALNMITSFLRGGGLRLIRTFSTVTMTDPEVQKNQPERVLADLCIPSGNFPFRSSATPYVHDGDE